MTKAQELQVRQSEVRQKLNELLGVETRTAEQQTELETLTAEAQKLEPELRAALAAEPDPEVRTTATDDPETRERLELRSKATFGGFLAAALAGRIASGAEAEYGAAFGARPGDVPMDLWEGDRPAPETRAATPAPATGTGVTVAPVQPFVFAPSIAPRLGIDMPSVGSGGYWEMSITTALPAAPKNNFEADGHPGRDTPRVRRQRRQGAGRIVRIGALEAALRSNVSMALSDEYDRQCINGDGTAPNVEGLIDQLTDPTNPTAVATFAAFLSAAADQIDGLWEYATDPIRPWRGVSPLGWAAVTGALAGAVEASLRDETGGPVGSIMPVPEGQTPGAEDAAEGVDPLAPLTAAIRAAAGRILVMETTAGGYGDKGSAPMRDWKAERFGPAPPDSMATVRDCVERSIYAATGIPAPLVSDRGDGTAGREALRRLVATTLQPLGRIIAAELRAKLHPGAELAFGSIAAADITGRARAWRTLVGRDGTMPAERASDLTGLS